MTLFVVIALYIFDHLAFNHTKKDTGGSYH